ncbi:MAG: M3 family metallopeptidase [Deltaproteobacteria bacterium]|nr:M3 family metallopeptidase [Deltaproteobacteria bacterium]
MSTNPLLQPSSLRHGAVPFGDIKVDHYLPALDNAIIEAKKCLDAIKADTATPNFANTFVALEAATAKVFDIAYVYSNLRSAHGDAAMQALAPQVMPRLIKLESDINLDSALFQRVETAFRHLPSTLTTEQKTLAEKTYRSFRRNGAMLSPADKDKLRALDEELSILGPKFSEHVLKATNAYTLVITDRTELAGLPDSALEAAAAAAVEKGQVGAWLFTLHAPSVLPLLKYAANRELRRTIWYAFNARAYGGDHDNQAVLKRIATLRRERAKLLGYKSHAHFQTEERMAESPENVRTFLARLLGKTKPAADREMQELRAFMLSKGCQEELQPWDYAYWSAKLKEEKFQLNAEETRPYFQLERVLAGAFEHARRLFDLEFSAVTDLPVYAEDVQVYEVRRRDTGAYMGLFYTDFFPRSTKSGGAWCTRFKSQFKSGEINHRPHVSIVCNFTKPTPTKPSLLTFQEVTTLFHEFGHALHSLLSDCEYRSLACTNVYRDFVELPSQILENWARHKDGLALFATHYETGELLPPEMVQKIIDGENFHAAYLMMRQLRFGYLDMAWHADPPEGDVDVATFERAAVAPTDLLPNIQGTNISSAFEHIFAGGYAAGYYGYKWAEVLDADAFELFEERGVFDREIADLFRRHILERGGSDHPMTLYKAFRGRAPDPDALLRRSQLI